MDASTSPGRHPYRFRQCEMRSLLQAGLEGTGAWRLAVAQWGAVTAVPVRHQAKVNLVIVPAGGTKRGQDFLPSQNFRQFSLWATRLDEDRKSTRLNSSHMSISYAVFCLKKKKKHFYHSPLQKKKNKK